ncbi:MAG: hypothetical protein AB9873_04865 [Syntrophobacteraceae bacterium]
MESRQKWEVDLFRPGDAEGVTQLFRMVYGDGYPVRTFIDPRQLIEENAAGRTLSSVARTTDGEIVGHSALYPSAPFKGLFESGATLIAPEYRGGPLAFRLLKHSLKDVVSQFGIEIVFGEPVCNHVITQKIAAKLKYEACALEVDLMPAEAYEKEASASGRVATLLTFCVTTPKPQMIHMPEVYADIVSFIYASIPHECTFTPSTEALPDGVETRVNAQIFDFANVARFAVEEAGTDFASVFEEEERTAQRAGAIVFQVWLKLSCPWISRIVDSLRSRGYFFGGVLPRWFDVDGLLMQKVLDLTSLGRR